MAKKNKIHNLQLDSDCCPPEKKAQEEALLQQLQDQLESLKSQYSALIAEIFELYDTLAEIEAEIDKLIDEREEKNSTVISNNSLIKTFTQEIGAQQTTASICSTQIGVLNNQLLDLNKTINDLQAVLAWASANQPSLVPGIQTQIGAANSSLANTKSSLETAKNNLNEANRLIKNLTEGIQRLTEENQTLEKEMKEIQEKIEKLVVEKDAIKSMIADKIAAKDKIAQEIDDKQKEIDALLESCCFAESVRVAAIGDTAHSCEVAFNKFSKSFNKFQKLSAKISTFKVSIKSNKLFIKQLKEIIKINNDTSKAIRDIRNNLLDAISYSTTFNEYVDDTADQIRQDLAKNLKHLANVLENQSEKFQSLFQESKELSSQIKDISKDVKTSINESNQSQNEADDFIETATKKAEKLSIKMQKLQKKIKTHCG